MAKLLTTETFSLKLHPEFNEKMIQQMIIDNPAILKLGDVVVKDVERIQPRAGRLDLLLQEVDGNRRYEVELQLGATDETHIIRTIEYWDTERKRYPQYDHCAVIVAEDITSRFFNVISLFNGTIPIIAIQMNAIRIQDQLALHFTKVLDEISLGMVEEDEATSFIASREYWEERSNKQQLANMDGLFKLVKELYPAAELNYNKFYVGLTINGRANNFVSFRPKRQHVLFEPKLPESDEIKKKIEDAGLECNAYNKHFKFYRIRIENGDVTKHQPVLKELIRLAYENRLPG